MGSYNVQYISTIILYLISWKLFQQRGYENYYLIQNAITACLLGLDFTIDLTVAISFFGNPVRLNSMENDTINMSLRQGIMPGKYKLPLLLAE